MDNSTPNRNQDEQNEFRFRNNSMNDSGVQNCSFLRNEALCSIKPPRILLNDVPLDMTINQTLFNQWDLNIDENIENVTVSSGLGSMVNALSNTITSDADRLTISSEDTIEDDAMTIDMDKSLLNRALCSVKPAKLLLNNVSFDTSINQSSELDLSANASGSDQLNAETTKASSKYSIEDDVIVIESDDEFDSINPKFNPILANLKPTINETRLKALHDISMQVVNAEKQKSPKRTMSLFSGLPSIDQPKSTEVIDLSEDDDFFNGTLERVDNILGDYIPTISEARLKTLHDISMQVVNVEKRKSPKRTMSLFTEMPDSIAEVRRKRLSKRTISVEQFI